MNPEVPSSIPVISRESSDTFKFLFTRRSLLSAKRTNLSDGSFPSEVFRLQSCREFSGDTITGLPADCLDGKSKQNIQQVATNDQHIEPKGVWNLDNTYSLSSATEAVSEPTEPLSFLQEFLRVHGFYWYHLIIFMFSVISYLADVISDAYLTITYYKQGDYYWSFLTLSLMILPAIIMTSFSLVWYLLDKRACVDPPRSTRAWTIRLFLHALQLAPIVRLTDAVLYGLASRRPGISLSQAVRLTQLMLYEDADSCMLRLMECFMESAPQLLLQLYIILSQPAPKGTVRLVAQYVSCVTSWLSLAWCLTAYQSALRNSRVEKANLRWFGAIFYFLWKASILAARILSLALFVTAYRTVIFSVCLFAHWIISIAWVIQRGTTFCSTNSRSPVEIIFDFVLATVFCFDVINVNEGQSRTNYTLCYALFGVENFVFSFTWYIRPWLSETLGGLVTKAPTPTSNMLNSLPRWCLLLLVVVAFIFGIFMMLCYYAFMHPSRNKKICKYEGSKTIALLDNNNLLDKKNTNVIT